MSCMIIRAFIADAALVPVLAQGEGLSYSYVEAAYVNTGIDQPGEALDGYTLHGSCEVVDKMFLFAGYTDQSATLYGLDLDAQAYDVGVGYAWPTGTSTDIYGKLGYVKVEIDLQGLDADDDGYELAAGMRSRLIDQIQVESEVSFVDLSDSGSDTTFVIGARWFFTEHFAVGVEGVIGGDSNRFVETYGIGVRWDFGD